MGSFAVRLSQTAEMWRRSVAPVAEWVSRVLWSALPKPSRQIFPATRLTQSRRREAKGMSGTASEEKAVDVPRLCRTCGNPLKRGKRDCASCAKAVSKANLTEAAKLGRIATHSARAEALRAATQRRHAAEVKAWQASGNPNRRTEDSYREEIRPLLARLKVPAIASALGISKPYATDREYRICQVNPFIIVCRLYPPDRKVFRAARQRQGLPCTSPQKRLGIRCRLRASRQPCEPPRNSMRLWGRGFAI